MQNYAFLPFLFLKFWYFEAPSEMLRFFVSLNQAFLHFFSLTLLVKTFFKPLKNEYRQGLVGFSRAMGILIKSMLIVADMLLLLVLVFVECGVFVFFIVFPLLTLWLLLP